MIRAMVNADIDQVVEIEKSLFASPWDHDGFDFEINQNPYGKYFVDEENGEIRAYIGLWIMFEQAQITTLATKSNYQRQHLASSLLQKAIDVANKAQCEIMSLEVRVSNQKAIDLYSKFNFEIVNIRKSYYQDNHEDAYLMTRAMEGIL